MVVGVTMGVDAEEGMGEVGTVTTGGVDVDVRFKDNVILAEGMGIRNAIAERTDHSIKVIIGIDQSHLVDPKNDQGMGGMVLQLLKLLQD